MRSLNLKHLEILYWIAILILVLAFHSMLSGCASVNKWTVGDAALQTGVIALLAADERQTEMIARNPDQFRETNEILGEHPSVGKVRGYFATAAVAHTTVAHFAPSICKKARVSPPRHCRTIWQAAWIFIQWTTVSKNQEAGLKLTFSW